MREDSASVLWQELTDWYGKISADILETLNPKVNEQQLDIFDRELSKLAARSFPSELWSVYLINNGQNHEALNGVFFGLQFLSVEGARLEWQQWLELSRATDNDSDMIEIVPRNAIRTEYASPYWIPFASDGAGNNLGIDLHPGSKGHVGQVINFGADEYTRFVIAPSFTQFLSWMLEQFQAGNYRVITRKVDNVEVQCVELREPQVESLLDVLPELFG